MVLSHTLPTDVPLKNPPSSLCNSSEEQPPAAVWGTTDGKMDGESFLSSLCGTEAVRKDKNCPVTVLYLL